MVLNVKDHDSINAFEFRQNLDTLLIMIDRVFCTLND